MTDQPSYSAIGDTDALLEGMPRWVKACAAAVIVAALLFVVLHLTGAVGHRGPGHHTSATPAGPIATRAL